MARKSRTRSAEAGRCGEDVPSDCWVKITLADAGGVHLQLKTKVESISGESTRKLVRDELATLGVQHARVELEDGGALPFVIMACVETAVRRLGLEDYTADIGTARTAKGRESFWARCQVVNAARAADVQPIDSVFSDVADMEGLRQSVLEAKSLGFEGMGCIHPRQIAVIHDAFAPTPEELEKAREIVAASEEAEAKGLGVVALGSKMIDPPVVKRAQRIVKLAEVTARE